MPNLNPGELGGDCDPIKHRALKLLRPCQSLKKLPIILIVRRVMVSWKPRNFPPPNTFDYSTDHIGNRILKILFSKSCGFLSDISDASMTIRRGGWDSADSKVEM
jgi:hypothetical protein